MKFYMFHFKLVGFHLDTDGNCMLFVGNWTTANYRGSLFLVKRFEEEWEFDFLCARTFYQIYEHWKEK